MKTKHAFAVIAAACLSAAAMGSAAAESESESAAGQRLGKLMLLPAMAASCHLPMTPEQTADVNKLAPKLQRDAGFSDDQMTELLLELAQGLKQADCSVIEAHWQDSVASLIAQARSDQ